MLGGKRQAWCYRGHWCYTGLRRGHPLQATVDHVLPVSRGGTSELGNLRIACYAHNTSRGAGRSEPKPTAKGTSRDW
jgi:5-methylcytosine-specific restriction endonuclease McrA